MNAVVEHVPVMLREVVEELCVMPGGRYVDCTVGTGGHAEAIMEETSPGGRLLGIDADPYATKAARERLRRFGDDVVLVNANYGDLERICTQYGFNPVHGVLFDLGLSSLQLEQPGRGFSFRHEDPLDMRFSPDQRVTAADIVNTLPEDELARLLFRYGEERRSHAIASRIVRQRPLRTTAELSHVVEEAVPASGARIHPATRTFQALRIAVNRELENLEAALKQAVNLLGHGGRLVVISFHSLEDRIVKEFIREESTTCVCPPGTPVCVCRHSPTLRPVTKRVLTPSTEEVRMNPRSHSAKLRAAERI